MKKEISELEAKATKWDMIQWAIDEEEWYVEGIWINKRDIERLEQLYKEREQVE